MRFGRRAALLLLTCFIAGVWATTASAAVRSLSGNARYQIGNGLPIPITLVAPPTGAVNAVAGAKVSTTPGGGIRFMMPNQLTWAGIKKTQGVFPANNAVFQVATTLAVGFPAAPGTLVPGGRTGVTTVTWCPGTAAPVPGAPGCGVFPGGGTIPGGVRYTATGAQFGGPMRATVQGRATVALRVAGTPPGMVTAINAFASPSGSNAIGGPFNVLVSTVAAVPGAASGIFVGSANAAGSFVSVAASGLGAGVGNGATSYGAPWTTGRITVSQLAASPNEIFVFSGSDGRGTAGTGTISLVSSSISARVLSGPNGNRGWLNLTILPLSPSVPTLGIVGGAALVLALAGIGARSDRRRSETV
jgi:hypothetical protein